MSIIKQKLTKLYYSIGEVAVMFDVNTSLIRFWEKEFSVLKPKKNKKGNRMFTVKDVRNLEKIYGLVKHKGYTLEGAKTRLRHGDVDVVELGNSLHIDIVERLKRVKEELLSINSEL